MRTLRENHSAGAPRRARVPAPEPALTGLSLSLAAEAHTLAATALEVGTPSDPAFGNRLHDALTELTRALARALQAAGGRSPHTTPGGVALVALAAERTAPIDQVSHACVRWREVCGRFLRERAMEAGLERSALADALRLVLDIFDGVLLEICSAVESEREQTDRRLRFLATHDPLTGLPNRVLIAEQLERLRCRPTREAQDVALVFLDLDNFKRVNDTLGHGAGDELLRLVAGRLLASVRGRDAVARLGGDEFVVLLADQEPAPELVAERLLSALRDPFILADGRASIRVTASIGVAGGSSDAAERLLRSADLAMYRAKAAGKDRYELAGTRRPAR